MNTERKIDLATGLLAERATRDATDTTTNDSARWVLETTVYSALQLATQSAITDHIRHKG